MDTRQFRTVEQLAHPYSCFTIGALRWQLFNRKRNGLDRAVVRVGRRLLIDEVEFVAWLKDHRETDRMEAAKGAA